MEPGREAGGSCASVGQGKAARVGIARGAGASLLLAVAVVLGPAAVLPGSVRAACSSGWRVQSGAARAEAQPACSRRGRLLVACDGKGPKPAPQEVRQRPRAPTRGALGVAREHDAVPDQPVGVPGVAGRVVDTLRQEALCRGVAGGRPGQGRARRSSAFPGAGPARRRATLGPGSAAAQRQAHSSRVKQGAHQCCSCRRRGWSCSCWSRRSRSCSRR